MKQLKNTKRGGETKETSFPSIYVGHSCWIFLKCLSLLFFFLSENAMEQDKRQLLREIEVMKEVGTHRNIVSMLGYWIQSPPIMLIMEYVPNGDLLQWLRNKRQQVSLLYQLYQ